MSVRSRARSRSLLLPLVLAGAAAGVTLAVSAAPQNDRSVGARAATATTAPASRIIVNLTVDERSVHRADQALTLARASRGQGREVVLFLNVDGPRLAAAGSTSTVGLPGKPALRAQLRSLIDSGVTVLVAKGCAGVCDVDLTNLVPGARPGTAGEIAALAADGGVVFSY
jgi:predicted peroxiredoxin